MIKSELYLTTYVLLNNIILLLEEIITLFINSGIDVDVSFLRSQKYDFLLLQDLIYSEIVTGNCSFSEIELQDINKNLLIVLDSLKYFRATLRFKSYFEFFLSFLAANILGLLLSIFY